VYGRASTRIGLTCSVAAKMQYVCPECSVSLIVDERSCPRCGAPIFAVESPPRGIVETCTQKGCGWQRWPEVDAAGARDYIELQVRDTGCGIPADDLLKIYEPFHSTKGAKGTGLGLSVVWGIVDNHNGCIAVRSKVGEGTTFTVRLPVKP
jgi:signal transduction histidine kinase